MPDQRDQRVATVLAAVLATTLVTALAWPAATVAQDMISPSAKGLDSGSCGSVEVADAEAALARELIQLVNAHRRARGLRAVRTEAALQRSAAWKARHMARHGYMAHPDLPGHRTLAQRLRACGFAGSGWGEVLAAGLPRPQAVLRAWLASRSHRAVIEARWWRAAGAGVARAPRGTRYWAMDFGS